MNFQVTQHGMGNAAILQAIADLGDQIANLGDRMDARMQNLLRREKTRSGTWTCLVVERPGANPMGAVPAHHPATRLAFFEMQTPDIAVLEAEFNFPAGHFSAIIGGVGAGDALAARLDALLEYLTEG